MLLLSPAQYEVTEKPAGQPIKLIPDCTDPTPLQVDKPEGHDQPTGENHSIGITFIQGAEPQSLFAQPLSGCMKAVIPLRASFASFGDGADVLVTAVVDSDSAHTAATEALLEFALGDVWLRTAVYVFDKLVEPTLLGASSIVEHGLVVDGASML
eukprot:6202824-Pleurochrysis_carterae.AAC.1